MLPIYSTLLGVLEKVSVIEAGAEHELRQRLGIGHLESDFVAPLVALNGLPVDMNVGGFLETLEDGAVVGL